MIKFKLSRPESGIDGVGIHTLMEYARNSSDMDKSVQLDILYTILQRGIVKDVKLSNYIDKIEMLSSYYTRIFTESLKLVDNYISKQYNTLPRYKEFFKLYVQSHNNDYGVTFNTFVFDYDITNKDKVRDITIFEYTAICLEVLGIEIASSVIYEFKSMIDETSW